MKVNFNRQFTGFDGKPLKEKINDELAKALFGFNQFKGEQVTPEQKLMAYRLFQKLNADGEVEISTEEASFIKHLAAESLLAGAYGQVYDLIEGNNN